MLIPPSLPVCAASGKLYVRLAQALEDQKMGRRDAILSALKIGPTTVMKLVDGCAPKAMLWWMPR
jgi:hypothetical protein